MFIIVLPTIFSQNVSKRVQLFISDGDSQEYGQIDNVIIKYFPNITRGRRGWYIVYRGWEMHLFSQKDFPEQCRKHYEEVKSAVQQ